MRTHPIRAYRNNHKPERISLGQLARKIGTSKPNLSRIETWKQDVSVELLPAIYEATGIAPEVLRPDLYRLMTREAAE